MSAALTRLPRRHESMARHVSWRVGGPAELFYDPANREDLCRFLAGLPADTPVFWVGLGSNLLVRDGGLRGAVIRTTTALGQLDIDSATGEVRAGAGAACAQVARRCGRLGLVGAGFLAGIPGTIGGALAMNAGAWGGETWEHVTAVLTVDRQGRIHERDRSEYRVGYRRVDARDGEWFVEARLRFGTGGDPDTLAAEVRELLARRARTQPTGQPSCGSVFRNPPGDHAARLIEAVGLKGHAVGGAEVSRKHANFIINTGAATARDIESLILHVQAEVARVHGVALIPEVRIVGEEGSHD